MGGKKLEVILRLNSRKELTNILFTKQMVMVEKRLVDYSEISAVLACAWAAITSLAYLTAQISTHNSCAEFRKIYLVIVHLKIMNESIQVMIVLSDRVLPTLS